MSIPRNRYRFFVQRYVSGEPSLSGSSSGAGALSVIEPLSLKSDGVLKDIERDFEGLCVKSVSGLNSYGNPKVYAESFADSETSSVYIPGGGQLEQTEITLTLYFFGKSMGVKGVSNETLHSETTAVYNAFMDYILGSYIVYFDNIRKRKVLMYLSSGVTPKTDTVKGLVYKEVELKFKNVYGRSFALDSKIVPPVVSSFDAL